MDQSQQILSDVTVFLKYAKYIPELNRRETWEEIVDRNMQMHIRKYPHLTAEITAAYTDYVLPRKVLPSMRSLQFGGLPVEISNVRLYNCAFLPIDHPDAFSEVMFLLLSGTGVGYGVQKFQVDKLPAVTGPKPTTRRFLIGDSIEGWADAIKVLIYAYFLGKATPKFDYRDIRPKGSRLVTSGGKAPGPDPLRLCIENMRTILNGAIGRRLKTIEAHDILCHIADAVLTGGIRRAAMIALFSVDDLDMLTCKSGNWYELNPQRGRANNSVTLHRSYTTEEQFKMIWARVQQSNAGEPGISWTNDYDYGYNPCHEIALKPFQFCNLTEINASTIVSQADFNDRAKCAAFIGTLQAGYTDFHYLRPVWKDTTEADALIGVGITGIASQLFLSLDRTEAAEVVKRENVRVANLLGINHAARTTTVKPSGTTSLVVGCSSGIHAWHDQYYIRRIKIGKNESLYRYMIDKMPQLVEDDVYVPHLQAQLSFPQRAPLGAILRDEHYTNLLDRIKLFNLEWVHAGYRSGANHNNVSCTISLKDDEWQPCGDWLWENRQSYCGISVMPFDGGSYKQTPFETISKDRYDDLIQHLAAIDLREVTEIDDNTSLQEQAACGGGGCEI